MDHEKHHFIPAFFLRAWESGDDQKLTAFERKNGRLCEDRYKAKSVGAQLGLYSFSDSQHMPPRNSMETTVFQRLDDQAALVHRALLESPRPLCILKDRRWWTAFIMSLMVRTPWEIDHCISVAPDLLADNMALRAREGLETWPAGSDESTAYMRDMTLFALPQVMWHSESHQLIFDAAWPVMNVEKAPVTLLLSDQAVFRHGPLEGGFLISMPLSPTRLLLISPQAQASEVMALAARAVAQRCNRTSSTKRLKMFSDLTGVSATSSKGTYATDRAQSSNRLLQRL